INPSLANFDEIYNDMTTMAFLLLALIRKIFITNGETFFDYLKFNEKIKKEILDLQIEKLKKELEEINKKNGTNEMLTNFTFSNRADSIIEIVGENNNDQKGGDLVGEYIVSPEQKSNDIVVSNLSNFLSSEPSCY